MKQSVLKKLFLLLLLITGVGQISADQGPWKYYDYKKGWWNGNNSRSYNTQDASSWGGSWSHYDDVNGMHIYNSSGTTNSRYMQSFHMLAYTYVSVPSYSRYVRTYVYDIYSHISKVYCTTNVFFFDSESSAKSYEVSLGQNVKDGSAHGYYYNNHPDNAWHASSDFSVTLTYDNRNGSSQQNIYKYLLLVNVAGNTNKENKDCTHEAGFRHRYYGAETWYYYKKITYRPNGATSSTSTYSQTIENSGTLRSASTYTRKNHIFAGWKDSSNSKVYSGGVSFTVNTSNKGAAYFDAQWTPIKFTLMNGSTQIAQFNASDNLTQLADSYKPTAGANQFFCGYYTQAGGKGIQVYDSNLNPTTAGLSQNFTANTTLYAHFITTQHTATWDYTYRTDHNTYENLNDHNRYCRLQFKDGSGKEIKSVYLTAPEVENVQNPNSSNLTTAKVVVDLVIGTEQDITNAANAKIYFTQAQLESMRGYQFDVWTTDGTTAGQKASLWVTTTNAAAHTTTFNYGQLSDNMFMLKWNVTLHDLNRYPDKIYAKPMILVNGKYQEIDQMAAVIGEDCYVTSVVKNSNNELGAGSYATYYGEYPVLKNETGGNLATYKVGMSGFYLAGSNYFLNQNEGKVSDDFVSGNAVTYSQSSENTITYHIYDYNIPVLQVLPALPTLGENIGATVNYLPAALYVDEARAGQINLSAFHPYRPHFNFLGWYDDEMTKATGSTKIWAADADYEFLTGTQPYGGTRTIVALWERDSDPEASIEMAEEATQFKYTITATDDAEVKAVKYMISAEEATAQTAGWTPLAGTDDKYVVTIPRTNNDYGKFLYVLVQNETRSIVLKYDDQIRSFVDIKANPDPDSRVANGHVEGEDENKTWVPDGTYSYTYYSTYYNSKQAFKLNGAVAFKVSELNERALQLIPISPDENGNLILPKGEAVILKNTTSNITLEAVDSELKPSTDNIFEGVDEETTQPAGYDYYIFSYAQKGLGFYLNSSNTLAAHKAFIKLRNDNPSSARAFIINTPKEDKSSEVTGITDIETTDVEDNIIYDLSGRKVSAPSAQGGIYIMGGKKVFIKK